MQNYTREQLEVMSRVVGDITCIADLIPGKRIAPYNQILPPAVSAAFAALPSSSLSVQTAAPSLSFSAEHELLKMVSASVPPPVVQPLQNPFQTSMQGNFLTPEISSVLELLQKSAMQPGQPLDNPFLSPPIADQMNLSRLSAPHAYPQQIIGDGFLRLQNYSNASELAALAALDALEAPKVTNQEILAGSSNASVFLGNTVSLDVGTSRGCLSDMPLNLSTPSSLTEPEIEPRVVRFAVPEVSQVQECSTSQVHRVNESVVMEFNNLVRQSLGAEARQLQAQQPVRRASIYPSLESLVAEALETGPKTELEILEHILTRPRNPQLTSADLQTKVRAILCKPNGPYIRHDWREYFRHEPSYYRKREETDGRESGITIEAAVKLGGLPESVKQIGIVNPDELEPQHVAFLEEHAAKISVYTGNVEFFNLEQTVGNHLRELVANLTPQPEEAGGPQAAQAAPAPHDPQAPQRPPAPQVAPKRGILKTSAPRIKQRNIDALEPEVKKQYLQQLAYAKHPNYGRYFCGHLFPNNNFIPPCPREIAKIVAEHQKQLREQQEQPQ